MRVSVVLLTYDHERYIAQAVDSVLAQGTPFDVELLISEDCSTDRTREIVLGYAARHPDRIRLFLSERNINTNEVTLRALRAARGELVAFLDGDDYWTSPRKLARQVEFLDAHPECSMCFHGAIVRSEEGAFPPRPYNPPGSLPATGIRELIESNFIAGCSPMIRREVLDRIPAWYTSADFGDWPLYIFAAERGTIGYIEESMGVYRVHDRGLWSAASRVAKARGYVRFRRAIRAHLGPSFDDVLLPRLAADYLDLGIAQEAEQRWADAARSFIASARLRPFTRAIAPGRRSWHLLRIAAYALSGRRLTPAEPARAIVSPPT